MAQELVQYTLRQDFTSPKVNLAPREMQSYVAFSKGQTIMAAPSEDNDPNSDIPPIVLTADGYAVPLSKVDQTGKAAAGSSTGTNNTTTPGGQIMSELSAIKGTSFVHDIVSKSKNSVNGMMIGAGAGIVWGLVRKNGFVFPMLIGAVLGGFIGNSWKISPKTLKQVNEKK